MSLALSGDVGHTMLSDEALASMEIDGFGTGTWGNSESMLGNPKKNTADTSETPILSTLPPPFPLFNPYSDGTEPCYRRIETPTGVIFEHATAGKIIENSGEHPVRTRWECLRQENIEKYDGNQWGRWLSKDEWETACWMATAKASQGSLEDLLKTERVSNFECLKLIRKTLIVVLQYASAPPRFKTAKKLMKIIQKEMSGFGGPPWHTRDIVLPEAPMEKHLLVFRDVEKCGDHLFGCPRFAGQMDYGPRVVLT